jgi:hypothetical protein
MPDGRSKVFRGRSELVDHCREGAFRRSIRADVGVSAVRRTGVTKSRVCPTGARYKSAPFENTCQLAIE